MYTDVLKSIELFQELPERWLGLVGGLLEERRIDEDEVVFQAGDPSDGLYIVESGSVSLFTDKIGEPVCFVGRVGKGELFGEVGALEDSRRSVSARAMLPSTVLKLSRIDLVRLVRAHRSFAQKLSWLAVHDYLTETSAIELGKRRELRIRVGRKIQLEVDGGVCSEPLLDNLSLGGACFRGADPRDWPNDGPLWIGLAMDDGSELLRVKARVAWRRSNALGVAFVDTDEEHRDRVESALGRLLAPEHDHPASLLGDSDDETDGGTRPAFGA